MKNVESSTTTTTQKCDVCNRPFQEKISRRQLKLKPHLIWKVEKVKCKTLKSANEVFVRKTHREHFQSSSFYNKKLFVI